jgi:hypothetical protein
MTFSRNLLKAQFLSRLTQRLSKSLRKKQYYWVLLKEGRRKKED